MSISGRRLQQAGHNLSTITVTATDITDTTATLDWTTVPGATGYLVGRNGTDSQGHGPWQTTVTAGVTSQSFIDLLPDTIYTLYCEPQPGGVRQSVQITTAEAPAAPDYDWSDSNVPWAYTSTNDWEQRIPAGAVVVNLAAGSDFYTQLKSTVDSAGKRVIVRLGTGVYHLNQFRMIGSSGDPKYAFGFWHPNLQGLIGNGPDKTIIQMDGDSMSQEQLDSISQMPLGPTASPLQTGMCRFDGLDSASPIFLGGVTFRAADQQMLTSVDPSVDIYTPQPAPHQGVILYSGSYGVVSHVRFQAAGRACTAMPPYEMANIGSQYGSIEYFNVESDGRVSPDLNAARPLRCGPYMGNNETLSSLTDCWLHHSNLSRYAVNDGNRDTSGHYNLTRVKLDHIATGNVDPALNNGNYLGDGVAGSSGKTECMGYESCNATITLTSCILEQNNTVPKINHIRLTTVSRNPQGGRLYVNGCEFRDLGTPSLDGYLEIWVPSGSYWYTDGAAATIAVKDSSDNQLQPYELASSAWPPTAGQLAAAGVTPQTHYLVRH